MATARSRLARKGSFSAGMNSQMSVVIQKLRRICEGVP